MTEFNMNWHKNNRLNEISKEIMNDEVDFIEYLSSLSFDDKEILADSLLLSIFLNERETVKHIVDENANKQKSGLKNKFYVFNPEHIMGYECLNRNEKTELKLIDRKPFKVCGSEGLKIEEIKTYENPIYTHMNRICADTKVKMPDRTFGSYETLCSVSNDSYYLYDKKAKTVNFLGNSPVVLNKELDENVTDEDIDLFINEKQTELRKKAKLKTLSWDDIYPLETVIDCLGNSYAHNDLISTKKYFLVPHMNPRAWIAVDKNWLKAIAETIVKSQDIIDPKDEELADCCSPQLISAMLSTYADKKQISLTAGQISMNHFLKMMFDSTSHASKEISARLRDSLKAHSIFTQEYFDKAGSLIYTYLTSIKKENGSHSSLPFSSKCNLFLLSMLGEPLNYEDPKTEIKEIIKNIDDDITGHLSKLTSRIKIAQSAPKNVYANLASSLANIAEKYELVLSDHKSYFTHSFICSLEHLDEASMIIPDLKAVAYLALNASKIQNLYDNISTPFRKEMDSLHASYNNEINFTNRYFMKNGIDQTIEKNKMEFYSFMAMSRPDLYEVDPMIENAEIFKNFKAWRAKINPVDGSIENKRTLKTKNFDYIVNLISLLRNSISHGQVGLSLNESTGKVEFCFLRDPRFISERAYFDPKFSKEGKTHEEVTCSLEDLDNFLNGNICEYLLYHKNDPFWDNLLNRPYESSTLSFDGEKTFHSFSSEKTLHSFEKKVEKEYSFLSAKPKEKTKN